MRIALIQAPQNNEGSCVPLGLLALASYVKQFGHHSIIIDFNLIYRNKKFSQNLFKQTAKEILNHFPDVLGFTAMCTGFPTTLLIAQECKKQAPQLPIIFGGPEVSFEETDVLKYCDFVDIIVRGEGEITLAELLGSLSNKTPLLNVLGITFRKNGTIIKNNDRPYIKDLDKLPFLDFSLLPNLQEYDQGQIEAGRGCPFNCTFCSTCNMWNRYFRIKSPKRIAKELEQAHALFVNDHSRYISINHDNLLASRKTAENLLSILTTKNLTWASSSRLDVLDPDLIKKLKKAGCQNICLGIESASAKIQKDINKNLTISRLPEILNSFSKNDFYVTLSFIIGFPNENKAQINQTLDLALRSKLYPCAPKIDIHSFTFLKGSKLYETYAKGKLDQTEFWHTDFSPVITNLPQEIDLIKKHPQLFPSFYCLKRDDLPLKLLEKTCILFSFLTEFFPLTTLLLLRHLSIKPLGLGQKIISCFDSAQAEWSIFQARKDLFCYYLSFLKKFIKTNCTLLIKEVFEHEEFFQKINFTENKEKLSQNKINQESQPRILKNVQIKAYHYDFFSLMKYLRTKKYSKIKQQKTYIAYVPGRMAQAACFDPEVYSTLRLCNGKKSVQEISEKLNIRIADVIYYLNYFQKQGIISIT